MAEGRLPFLSRDDAGRRLAAELVHHSAHDGQAGNQQTHRRDLTPHSGTPMAANWTLDASRQWLVPVDAERLWRSRAML